MGPRTCVPTPVHYWFRQASVPIPTMDGPVGRPWARRLPIWKMGIIREGYAVELTGGAEKEKQVRSYFLSPARPGPLEVRFPSWVKGWSYSWSSKNEEWVLICIRL